MRSHHVHTRHRSAVFVTVRRGGCSGATGGRRVGTMQFDLHTHHRWRLHPTFKAGDALYYDRDETYTVTSVPETLLSKPLMRILTAEVCECGTYSAVGREPGMIALLLGSRPMVGSYGAVT